MVQFLHSTEFYVLLLTFAAAIIAIIAKPTKNGPVETDFHTAILTYDTDTTPRIEIRCLENGDLVLSRCGLSGLTDAATVALALSRKGFELTAEERITPGSGIAGEANRANFIIKGLPQERYHIKYNSGSFSTFTATGFTLRPGVSLVREFPR